MRYPGKRVEVVKIEHLLLCIFTLAARMFTKNCFNASRCSAASMDEHRKSPWPRAQCFLSGLV